MLKKIVRIYNRVVFAHFHPVEYAKKIGVNLGGVLADCIYMEKCSLVPNLGL
jgi:hypothetical protein